MTDSVRQVAVQEPVHTLLAALGCVSVWALPALSLITDPSVASATLDRTPGGADPATAPRRKKSE